MSPEQDEKTTKAPADILDIELVRKYFGCQESEVGYLGAKTCGSTCAETAVRVLRAMKEPIKRGELYLQFAGDELREMVWGLDKTMDGFHAFDLRLPDRFQKKVPGDGKAHTDHFCCYEDEMPHGQGVLHECRLSRPHRPAPPDRCEPLDAESALQAKFKEIQDEVPACDFRKPYAREWLTDRLNELIGLAAKT